MISQQTIEEIKTRMDIVEVVSDFVTLKKSGQNYKAKSPFTEERTPSFVVSPQKGIFKCFSTGKGGDAITFVMEVDGLNYVEALKYLAGKYQINIEEDQPSEDYLKAQNERESLFIVLSFAKNYFHDNLFNSEEGKRIGLSYLKERGFTDESIQTFDLGYSHEKWDGLIQEAKSKGYNLDYLEKTGLIIRKENKEYDRFRGRVTFPVHNVSGKVIAFGARIIGKKENQPKYINSPETELYHKSDVLYGIAQAKQALRIEDNCYLVEGYTDVISLHQAGIKNVVASSGTSLTSNQIQLIKRYTQNVSVLYDGDKAGIKASFRGIDLILEADMNVEAITFPDGEDPDSYSKKLNPSSLKSYLKDQAKDFISFKTTILESTGTGSPLERAEVVKEVVQSISKIPNAIKRNVYIQECGRILKMGESVLNSELNKILRKNHFDQRNKAKASFQKNLGEATNTSSLNSRTLEESLTDAIPQESDVDFGLNLSEQQCLRVLLNYGEEVIEDGDKNARYLAEYFLKEIEDVEFKNPIYKKILDIYKANLEREHLTSGSELVSSDDQEIKQAVSELLIQKYEVSDQWIEKYKIHIPQEIEILKNLTLNNLYRLKLNYVKKMVSNNLEELSRADDEEKSQEIMIKHQHLKSMEMEIAKVLGNVLTS